MSFWVAGAVLVGGAYSAREGRKASDKAIGASSDATDETIKEGRRQYNQTREDTQIARETSDDALMTLGFLLGVRKAPTAESISALESQISEAEALRTRSVKASQSTGQSKAQTVDDILKGKKPTGTPGKKADIGAIDANIAKLKGQLDKAKRGMEISQQYAGGLGDFIKNQPGYEFGLQEGTRTVGNQLSASGTPMGGRAMKALERYGQDYASTKTDQHLGRLFTLAGYGPAATNTTANAGQNFANTVGNASMNHAGILGDAAFGRASANIGAVNNALNTGMTLWSYNNSRPQPRTSSPSIPDIQMNYTGP